MSLRDVIAADLPFLQGEAESLMVDTCVVRYATGTTAQNETTGAEEPVYADRFTSRCKVQSRRSLTVLEEEIGGRTATTVRLELHLPVCSDAAHADDVVEITAIGCDSDPQLLGRKFRIMAPSAKTFQTARRFDVEEIVR